MAPNHVSFRLVLDRAPSGNSFWRVYFRHPESGKLKKISTGIQDDGSKAAPPEAQRRAVLLVEEAKRSSPPRETVPTFGALAEGFWDWDKSQYIRAMVARDPRSITREHAYSQACNVRIHVRPWVCSAHGPNFGVPFWEISVKDVSPDILDALVTDLLCAGLSTQTVKHVIYSISPIFKLAQRRSLISYSPIKLMMPFKIISKTRDAFSLEEIRKLLNPKTVSRVWSDQGCPRKEFRSGWRWYAMAVFCMTMGPRWGAVAALDREDIHLRLHGSDRYYEVEMTKVRAAMDGVKPGSKTGSGVTVPVDAWVMELILPHLPDSGPLFPGRSQHGRLTHRTAIRHLHEALRRIGITQAKISERLLGFHSFRHAFVTQARRAGISLEIRQAFTEHKDLDMDTDYSHLKPVDLLAVGPIQRSMIAG